MNRFVKRLLTMSFAFVMAMAIGVVNVEAASITYALEDRISDFLDGSATYELDSTDTLTFSGNTIVGVDGLVTINSGTVEIKYNTSTSRVEITINGGTATINNEFIMQLSYMSNTYPITLTVGENSTLNIDGALAIPSGSKGILVNNGTVNVNVNGSLEVRASGTYTSTGTTNVYGNFVVYGSNLNNITAGSIISLYSGGNVYYEGSTENNTDIYSYIVIGETDADNYEIVENDKTYSSITASLISSFNYGYTVKAKDTTDTSIDVTTDDSTSTAEVSSEENPETSDGVLIFLGLTAIGFAGVAVTFKRIRN